MDFLPPPLIRCEYRRQDTVVVSRYSEKIAYDDRLAVVPIVRKPSNAAHTIKDYRSIQSMQLPDDFVSTRHSHGGHANLSEIDHREFQSTTVPHSRIGLWHHSCQPGILAGLREVLRERPHDLTNEDFFKIGGLTALDSPLSAENGRDHEIAVRTEVINGKKVLVYESWRANDLKHDVYRAEPHPEDFQLRIVFFPNELKGTVDVVWLRSPIADFHKNAAKFNKSLESIKWR